MHHFQILQGQAIGNDIELKIARFGRYIYGVDQTLRNLRQIAQNKIKTQQNYYNKLKVYFETIDKYQNQIKNDNNNNHNGHKNSWIDKFG